MYIHGTWINLLVMVFVDGKPPPAASPVWPLPPGANYHHSLPAAILIYRRVPPPIPCECHPYSALTPSCRVEDQGARLLVWVRHFRGGQRGVHGVNGAGRADFGGKSGLVNVVVVAHGSEPTLGKCLEALTAAARRPPCPEAAQLGAAPSHRRSPPCPAALPYVDSPCPTVLCLARTMQMAALLKYLDNIARVYAAAVSMMVVLVASWPLFGVPIAPQVCTPGTLPSVRPPIVVFVQPPLTQIVCPRARWRSRSWSLSSRWCSTTCLPASMRTSTGTC